MKFQRKKVATALAYTLGVGGALTLSAAYAQTDIRVDVTGSSIKRVEGEGALPVQVITKQDIQATGATNTFELLDKLSGNQSFGAFNPALGEGSGLVGFSGVSLRGLGTNRTLVLIDGKRIAPYALSTANNNQGVDLSQIPLAAIERIEILKDGASAVYGTDAIAGVINIILRRDFQGVEVGGTYLDSEAGGGGNHSVHMVLGWGDLSKDKINAFVALDYQQQLALRASDREISKTAFLPDLGVNRTSGNSIPANISIPGVGGTHNPFFPACLPPLSFPTPGFSPNQCRFDFAATIDTIPPSDKTNILGKVTWQFNPDNRAFLEGSYNHGEFQQNISPTPVGVGVSGVPFPEPQLQPGSRYYPAAYISSLGGDPTKPVSLSYRAAEFGPRSDKVTVDQYRAVGGITGTINGKWDYTADINWTRNREVDAYAGGYLSASQFLPLLDNGVINPFALSDAAGHAAGLNAQIIGNASVNVASNIGGNATISGEIWKLPAGPLSAALGAEYRKEKLSLENADFLSSGDIIGGLGAIPSLSNGERNVWGVYTEFNIPIVKTLEGDIAVRYDHYSDFGSTTNPKFSLRWQPSQQILLRASWGKGFRAPTLFDLDQPDYTTNTNNSFDDPIRCPITGSVLDCQLQFNSLRGGNPALKPERSTQYSVGGVWEPAWQYTQGLSVGVDYFWVEIKDVITQIGADTIFADFNTYANTPVPGFGGRTYIVRRPGVDPAFPNLPNSIDYVIEPTVNAGKNGVDGFDFDARYRFPGVLFPTAWGRMEAHLNGTYIAHFKQTDILTGAYPNFAGTSGFPQGAISRWRHYATLDYTYGPWGATFAQNFQNGYTEPDLTSDDPNATRRVGNYETYDLQGRYTGFKNVELSLGIRNLFNRAPPQVGDVGTFQVGYDASYGDPRGRMYYGTVSVAFK